MTGGVHTSHRLAEKIDTPKVGLVVDLRLVHHPVLFDKYGFLPAF